MIKRLKRLLQGVGNAAPGQEPAVRVLMVCMGNICRSPSAEAVLRAQLQRAGLDGKVLVDSAGTHGYHTGEPPDPRATQHAARRGYDLASQRARPVVEADFERFDHILAMDADNLAWLQRKAPPAAASKLGLLMAHATRHPTVLAVPDPYYGPPQGFDHVLDLLEDACTGLVPVLAAAAEPASTSGSPPAKLD
jgi:protein-tyrosine phosphatase